MDFKSFSKINNIHLRYIFGPMNYEVKSIIATQMIHDCTERGVFGSIIVILEKKSLFSEFILMQHSLTCFLLLLSSLPFQCNLLERLQCSCWCKNQGSWAPPGVTFVLSQNFECPKFSILL